jgi:hypothetical protein
MGQAKIKRLNRERELAARAAGAPPQPAPAAAAAAAQPEPPKAARPGEHVKINCQQVVLFGRQADPRFLSLYWDMQDRFGDRNYGYEVCLHEAAHAILMEQDGIPNVRFEKPMILYDPQKDEFPAFGAMVRGDDTPNQKVDEVWIFTVATHAVVGGIALQKYLGVKPEDDGDDRDYADFERRCKASPDLVREKPDVLWKRAQDAVCAKLDDPRQRARIEARAKEYLALLYP